MSEIKVNKISPRTNCGTVQLGDSGDTITIPAGATITNNGTQTGFGRTGTVDWDTTPKTATFSAVSGDGFFCNTTAGAFTCNLPAGSAGAIVSLADYAGTWQTNNLTVSPNGSEKIGGVNADVILNTEGQSVTFVYVDGTQGWINVQDSTSNERGANFITATGGTITTSGNCKIHTFTGPGTFTVCSVASCSSNNVVSYMVVAGGGGGGAAHSGGGGGGAGGFREDKSPVTPYTASPLDGAGPITVTATAFPITVGGGGSAGTFSTTSYPGGTVTAASSGANSVFSTITSAGGGRGASDPAPRNGDAGGSGGGGANSSGCGGAGNTPPVSPSQGFPGGDGNPNTGGTGSGGGGGATAAGTDIGPGTPANGGNGATTSITASPTAYGGGGGGGSHTGDEFGSGGTGGGGDAYGPSTASTAGTANTGGGGGAGTARGSGFMGSGAAGGSGIVVIRYKFQ